MERGGIEPFMGYNNDENDDDDDDDDDDDNDDNSNDGDNNNNDDDGDNDDDNNNNEMGLFKFLTLKIQGQNNGMVKGQGHIFVSKSSQLICFLFTSHKSD